VSRHTAHLAYLVVLTTASAETHRVLSAAWHVTLAAQNIDLTSRRILCQLKREAPVVAVPTAARRRKPHTESIFLFASFHQ